MKILALESSATVASVALCEEERVLGEYTLNTGNTHSETLLPMVESILRLANVPLSEIDLFATAAGPGSFTGVRIGAATLKGLAFGQGKPCIGVSSLEAMAYNLPAASGLICPVMNARRGQVYTAIFRNENGVLARLLPDSAIPLTELDGLLLKYNEPVMLVGDGYDMAAAGLHCSILPTPERLRLQSAASVAKAARLAYLAGVRTTDLELAPTYLRPCQAERERLERLANENQPR